MFVPQAQAPVHAKARAKAQAKAQANDQVGADRPLFSVIIPLEFHRGQWEQSWLGWTSQTVDRSLFEIILVVPLNFSQVEQLAALVGDNAQLEFADSIHDIGLCAIGAARARGTYLFFTESHCRPEPNVLELCLRAFHDHPEWSGFSCKSVPVCHNRLSEAEAAMYQADIDYGMQIHPWRKVLDQCFVTRREPYEACGGLREEFGHFAEWVLAVAYHAHGYVIGYIEDARFHHYYVGRIGDLKTFTLDFVEGEIRHFSGGRRDPGSELLEIPIEWSCQDNFDAALARKALHALVRFSLTGRGWRQPDEQLRAAWRWTVPALVGDHMARASARIASSYSRAVLTTLALIGPSSAVTHWMKRYIASLIRVQRLDCIGRVRGQAGEAVPRLGANVLAQAGFHDLESSSGFTFRWSEPQAAVRIKGAPGPNRVCIRSPPLRGPLNEILTQFYLDGRRVDAAATGDDSYTLSVDLPPSGIATLAWACSMLRGTDDSRRLGLSVTAIEVEQE